MYVRNHHLSIRRASPSHRMCANARDVTSVQGNVTFWNQADDRPVIRHRLGQNKTYDNTPLPDEGGTPVAVSRYCCLVSVSTSGQRPSVMHC